MGDYDSPRLDELPGPVPELLPRGLLKDLPDTLLCHGAALDVLDGPQFPRHRLPLLVPHRGLILRL